MTAAQSGDKLRRLTKIVAVVGVAHDHVAATRGTDAAHKRVAISPRINQDDARAVCLRLTAAGHRRVHAWRDRSTQTVDRALESLDAEERAALALALPAFRHLVDVIAAGTPAR